MSDILLSPPRPGDMGWVTHRHGVLDVDLVGQERVLDLAPGDQRSACST